MNARITLPRRSTAIAGALALATLSGQLPSVVIATAAAPSWELPPHQQSAGVFWREHWYQRGLTNHNPSYTKQFRINSPEVVLHPNFGRRKEARENGLMLIQTEEDLFQITGAEFYAEMWGGHPGTANKRVTVNGRSTYALPRVGAEDGHCTYFYPVVPLRPTDLVNGWSAFQFTLDQGATFWGHSLIENACVRVALTNGHADLVKLGLNGFAASVAATAREDETKRPLSPAKVGGEGFLFELRVPDAFKSRIGRVDFQAWYSGYDENGNLLGTDWHGFTKNRQPIAHVGSAGPAEASGRADGTGHPSPNVGGYAVTWDTSMLPAQKQVAVRALVHFLDAPELVFVTSATTGLEISEHPGAQVSLYLSPDLPKKFWSRANKLHQCSLVLDLEPASVERAELYVLTWTGGAGKVKDYFKLNGKHFPVAEGSGHELQFNRLPVEPALLRKGTNTIELHSDTDQHGIEISYPGPALMLRYKAASKSK